MLANGQAYAAEIPQSRTEIEYSYAPLVKQAAPAVVNIFASRKVRQEVNPLFNDPFVRQFFGGNLPGGQMMERVQNSLGSGVIVRSDGLVVTNVHVIQNADEIRVVLNDRREFPATVVLKDERADLAVLRIKTNGEKLPALPLADSDQAEVGDLVLAIGNPFGVGQTVTSGIVSALGRSAEGVSSYNEFIQTDAAINPGNSGGALLDMNGRLLAINSAIYSRDGGSLGIGFAIPANIVRAVVEAAETGKTPVHPWVGLEGQPVSSDIANSLNMPRPEGLLISSVNADGPAAKAGIKVGDVLLNINNHDVEDMPSLRSRLAAMKEGAPADFSLFRAGETLHVSVTPIAPPETPARDLTELKGRQPLMGATVENISPAVIEETGISNTASGVIITAVAAGSTAAQVGFQPGDLVLAVNNNKVASVHQLVNALAAPAPSWHVVIQRGGQTINLTIND
jgi:serine protease Do